MKIHILEAIGGNHLGANVGEELIVGNRKMKVTNVEVLDEATHRLTLED